MKEIYLGDWLGLEDINLVAKAKSTVAVITPYVHNTWMRQSGNAVAGKRTAYPVSSNAMLCCCPDAICTMFFPSSALMYTTQTLVRIIRANGKYALRGFSSTSKAVLFPVVMRSPVVPFPS